MKVKINYDDVEMIAFLQKYIPITLNNEIYFQKLICFILKRDKFNANQKHLRKKLDLFYHHTYRDDIEQNHYRLIRGKFISPNEDNISWIFLSSGELACILEYIMEGYDDNQNIMNDELVGEKRCK